MVQYNQAIPWDPPAWTSDELLELESLMLMDRHLSDLRDMQSVENHDFELSLDWVLSVIPSSRKLVITNQVMLALSKMHFAIPD